MVLKDKEAYNAYMREYMVKRYHRLHAEWIQQLGGICAQCGSLECLEIDHIDPATKSFDISHCNSHAKKKIQEELTKCQVLCHTCHKTKSDTELSVEHGGGVSGKRNCSCASCKSKKRTYMAAYNMVR